MIKETKFRIIELHKEDILDAIQKIYNIPKNAKIKWKCDPHPDIQDVIIRFEIELN